MVGLSCKEDVNFKEERKMGIVVSVVALALYIPMSMVFVFGGEK